MGWIVKSNWSWFPRLLLLALFILIGTIFILKAQILPNISDTIAYVYAAERLADGHGLTFEDPNNQPAEPYFSMYGFQIRRPDAPGVYLGFPPGLPALLALGILLTGEPAAVHYIVPVLAAAGLIVTYVLGTLLSNNEWVAFWSAALLAFAPAYWEFGTAAWSEVPSMLVMATGVCFYLYSRLATRPLRKYVALSVLAGLLISFSFFIRYANVVILPALALYELVTARERLAVERQRWLFFLTVSLGLGGIFLFNHFYYGGVFLTSYSPVHGWYPSSAFSLAYALGPSFVNGYSFIEAGKTLWSNFPILIMFVPFGWLLLPRASGVLVATATVGTLGLYSFYAFAPTGINSRFLLPAFPFLVVAASQTITTVGQRLPSRQWRWIIGLAIMVLLVWPIPTRLEVLDNRNTNDVQTIDSIRELSASTEQDAVLLSYVFNDHLAYYGDRSVLNYRRIPRSDPAIGRFRWEMLEPCLIHSINGLLEHGTAVYYVEDSSPPFADSLAILRRHFLLDLEETKLKTYRVSQSIIVDYDKGSNPCQP